MSRLEYIIVGGAKSNAELISWLKRYRMAAFSLSLSCSLSPQAVYLSIAYEEILILVGMSACGSRSRCFRCPVFDGYGATEVGGIGVDGILTADVEVRLEDAPELGYTTADKPNPRSSVNY